jgi:RNA polymerase sigma-70 factor (ECF subfamily)
MNGGHASHLTSLALAAGAGDRQALEALVRATQADVWRLLAHLADRDHADDLTQETYLRVFRALPAYRADCAARIWVLAIARRVAADHIRRARRRRAAEAAAHPAASPSAVSDPAEGVVLRQLIACLDPDRRAAFVLTQLLGLSYEEAATACDCPVGTIRSRVARARSDLITALHTGQRRHA